MGGKTNYEPARVPFAVATAAAWSWRLLVIGIALVVLLLGMQFFALITMPVVAAILLAALSLPVLDLLVRLRFPRWLAAGVVVLGGIGLVTLLMTFVTQQIIGNVDELSSQVADGLGEIRSWLRDGPLNVSDSQLNTWIVDLQDYVRTRPGELIGRATVFGSAVGQVLAGLLIALFTWYFMLKDGREIWNWVVSLLPKDAQQRVDRAGDVAWVTLTKFIEATVVVAAVDAIAIMIIAAILDVPLVVALGVLVFLGGFVPMIGATVTGGVAVLVALVAQGPIAALIMLIGVIVVQQLEGNVLQPFLMGKAVAIHPLGILLAVAAGVIVAGIAGALVAVPIVAVTNVMIRELRP